MIGKPKYNYGDKVKFTLDNITYSGEVYIIDKYGTFTFTTNLSETPAGGNVAVWETAETASA